ncbi:hypothetical protein K461DRAFT_266263 [Myriangium duriaei CBS 260.36]|uniref:Uncharacterized protein n=1 Tax=Myriangium duriaei CBS 260.36 TaxID=1168546 RepID=A0A9P4MHL7_9PEZI|nr:hypothetical protein K461DRAFT_266263 [Myriangium duriaei CBS 260.36]
MSSPFHRLLSFFATRSSPKSQTITFLDSLRGDLSLGLNFPVAVFLAVTRHLVFRNTGAFSLTIHVPTVKTSRVLLGGPGRFDIDENRRYGLRELVAATSGGGLVSKFDAVGCWGLIAERDGTVSGRDVRAFQRGEVMEEVVRRRRGRADVLPFWRGGPILVDGHSWMVKKLFDVDVYRKDVKTD